MECIEFLTQLQQHISSAFTEGYCCGQFWLSIHSHTFCLSVQPLINITVLEHKVIDGLDSYLVQSNIFITQYFDMKYSQRTLHSSPVRASYEVSFVSSKSDLYPVFLTVILYMILLYNNSCYNDITHHIIIPIMLTGKHYIFITQFYKFLKYNTTAGYAIAYHILIW